MQLLAWRLAMANLSRTDLASAPSPPSSRLGMCGCTRTRSGLATAAVTAGTAAAVAPSTRTLPQGSRHPANYLPRLHRVQRHVHNMIHTPQRHVRNRDNRDMCTT